MLTALTTKSEIGMAQSLLQKALRATLNKSTTEQLGYQGGSVEAQIYYHDRMWFSGQPLPEESVPRYWNAFGLGVPTTGPPNIVVEINPPLSGYTRQVAGLYARGGQRLYMLHTGKIGGGKKGIGKDAFLESFRGKTVQVKNDKGETASALLVGEVSGSGFADQVLKFVLEVDRFKRKVAQNLPRESEDDIEVQEDEIQKTIENDGSITSTEKTALVKARLGQGKFKGRVRSLERKCRVTGVTDVDHLRASHIKPWRACDNKERLDGNNGLLLSPHVDHLFDRGYITFTDDGRLRVAETLLGHTLSQWHIRPTIAVGHFNKKQREYLEYHRDHIFQK